MKTTRQPRIANASDVTWGAHPAHGSTWLKLRAGISRKFNAERMRQGWELVFVPKGEAPKQAPTISPEPKHEQTKEVQQSATTN